EEHKLCLLVMIGVRADGRKELIALADGYRESAESWADSCWAASNARSPPEPAGNKHNTRGPAAPAMPRVCVLIRRVPRREGVRMSPEPTTVPAGQAFGCTVQASR